MKFFFSLISFFFTEKETQKRESYVDKGREAPMTTSTNPRSEMVTIGNGGLVANGRERG